jgi:hypothetical protein
MSLDEKAAHFQAVLEGRDRRHGYVTLMELPAPGVLAGAVQETSDNDGLWTALHIAAQSFRYAATGDPGARALARRSMQALIRLETITGIPGFPARAICRPGEPGCPAGASPPHREWRPSPVEDGWWWKGDTSSDELDGHFFAFHVFSALAADDEERAAVRAAAQRIMDHILDHGYRLVDADGEPTTWGVWAPAALNDDPRWWEERGLNSLEILSHLKVAHALTGERRYEDAYRELIDRHRYAINALRVKVPGGVSHDDQLAFLAYYPLLQLETDPGLRALYTASLEHTWSRERLEANPLWNFIYGASTGAPCDVEAAVATLRDMPLDLVLWPTRNAHRADLRFDPALAARGVQRLLRPLPLTERPLASWDADPFVLDGGSGLVELDPTVWLLPYWLGRRHGLVAGS